MNLSKGELHALFVEKQVNWLYHANTVGTTITFIEQNGLISRHFVEASNLRQTPQSSDEADRQFDVFDDVFLDTTDLHTYFHRQNFYGPVTFKLRVDLVLMDDIEVWVTKNNPIYWKEDMRPEQKYFQSVDELRNEWDHYDRQRKMVTIRKPGRPLFFDLIEEIIVDDPRVQNKAENFAYFNAAVKGLRVAYTGNDSLRSRFRTRACENCYCRANYSQLSTVELNRLFLPL
jgi:hypothetical protein